MVRYKLEIETYVHATESLDRVVSVITKLLGNEVPIVIEVMWGHYGNPIFRVYSVITDEDEAITVLTEICRSLTNVDYLIKTLSSRVDNKDIYLRLSKQWMAMGKYVIDDGDDVVRIRLRIEGDNAMEFIKRVCGV